MKPIKQKYRYCCKCEDGYLGGTHVNDCGYGTVDLQLKDDGVINYTCFHCRGRKKENHDNFEPVEVETHFICKHIKQQLDTKEKIEVNMFKNHTYINDEYHKYYCLRCVKCCEKAKGKEDGFFEAAHLDQMEGSDDYIFDCKDDPEEEIDEDEENSI